MTIENPACPLPFSHHDTIQMGHGSGGRLMADLIDAIFKPAFANPILGQMDDSAVIDSMPGRLAFTTDSYVVDPLFFPGGDIGDLAVNGTVNDLSMSGARPLYLSAAFILEEGFPLADLQKITASMQRASLRAGVQIVCGDTKVVDRGKGDKLFITTSGIGLIQHPWTISSRSLQPGDAILVSGTLGDHGIAVLSQRRGLQFETQIRSDTAPLNEMVQSLLDACDDGVHALRDATRGGLTAVLNEFARASQVGIEIDGSRIPVQPAVANACELLGLDPLHLANEGKLVAVVQENRAEKALRALQNLPLGKQAAVIGRVVQEPAGQVSIKTGLGNWRILDQPAGEPLPRIC